jgi:hypothetical protein
VLKWALLQKERPLIGGKTCDTCGVWKTFSNFHKCKVFVDGHAYKCKECKKAYDAALRLVNPEKYQERLKKNRDKNAPKILAKQKEFEAYIAAGVKVCTKCGVEKPFEEFHLHNIAKDGRTSKCKVCLRAEARSKKEYNAARHKEWARKNPEKARAIRARTRERHRDRRNENTRSWRKRNVEHVAEYAASYEESRKETRPAKRREQYAANPEPHRARHRAYAKNNPDQCRVKRQRRRARKRNAGGSHTAKQLETLLAAQNHECANPHCRADLRKTRKAVDHIVALANGGSNGISNIQWLCVPCNQRKSNLDLDVWLRREAQRKTGTT